MTTSYYTKDVELGPSQSTTTVPPPIHVGHKRVESQVVIVSVPAAAEPPRGNTNADPDDPTEDDEDAPPPLGVKLTVYRLLNIVVVFTIGLAKFISSLKGQSIAPSGLEWGGGSVLVILLYWIGLYETVEPPRWGWFLHVDWAPGIGFVSKRFLGGVLFYFVNTWISLPFTVAMSIWIIRPWLFLEILIWASVNGALSGSCSSLVCGIAYVWAPIRRFFRRYGSWSGKSADGQYRLIGNICFGLGVLSGNVLRVVFWYLCFLLFFS